MKKILASILFVLIVGQLTSCKNQECPPPETHELIISGKRMIDDANINSTGIMENSNFGADGRLTIGAWTWSSVPGTMRAFIKFNLSSLPLNAKIQKAELVLFADTSIALGPDWLGHHPESGDNDWRIERVLSSWDEKTITWLNQPDTDDSEAIQLPGSTDPAQTYRANVTNYIRYQYEHPEENFGLMLRINTEDYYRSVAFCASEHMYSQLGPKLKITYSH